MSKSRFQVTINSTLVDKARRDMAARGFNSLSEYLDYLIREEWERQHPPTPEPPTPLVFEEPMPAYRSPSKPRK